VNVLELKLEEPEVEILREILDGSLRDLKYEIADTDNLTFKRKLRDREALVRSILDKLGSSGSGKETQHED